MSRWEEVRVTVVYRIGRVSCSASSFLAPGDDCGTISEASPICSQVPVLSINTSIQLAGTLTQTPNSTNQDNSFVSGWATNWAFSQPIGLFETYPDVRLLAVTTPITAKSSIIDDIRR